MTDQRAVEVLREKFADADRRRERMVKAAWLFGAVAVLTLLIWGMARAIDMGQF